MVYYKKTDGGDIWNVINLGATSVKFGKYTKNK